MPPARTLGFGCMRLSTAPDRDPERAVAVLHAALDAGATLLDTADAYAHDEHDIGHNERLVAHALATWPGDRGAVRVATKGGLVRPAGAWRPDGRARHLRAACEASLAALGVARIDLYQLHAPDPRTPFVTSVRALAKLQADGLIAAVGLCNVRVEQIEAARAHVDVAAVQVALGPRCDEPLRNGVAAYCAQHGIELIAHSPLGGPRAQLALAAQPALATVAARHGVSPQVVALAWLCDLGALVVPIPGATQIATARSLAAVRTLAFDDRDRSELADACPSAARAASRVRAPARASGGEVVLVMGSPAAGKTTLAERFVAEGYQRLNRDLEGGRLADLLPALDRGLAAGGARFVLDNTYPTRAARDRVLEVAARHGARVRCVWLDTEPAQAQRNAVERMLRRYGELLDPGAIALAAKTDPGVFDPRALFRYARAFEPPVADEGFAKIERVAFARAARSGYDARAVLLDDSALVDAENGERSGCRAALARHRAAGYRLLVHGWRPDGVGPDLSGLYRSLGIEGAMHCLHGAGPPRCWCRKPLPGMAVAHAEHYRLDLARCLLVGGTADCTLAARLGGRFVPVDEFVGEAGP